MTKPAKPADVKHLWYEIEMLRYTHNRLGERLDKLVANALMESFAIHARNLIDFLFNRAKEGRYIARDFLPENHLLGDKDMKDLEKRVKEIYGRIHDEVLHMGRSRPASELDQVGQSERQKLFDAIESRLPQFLDAMKPEYKEVWTKLEKDRQTAPGLDVRSKTSNPLMIGGNWLVP